MVSAKWSPQAEEKGVINLRAAFAELLAMFLFVGIGCGVACGNGASDGETRLLVAFSFGVAILVLAYTIGHISGGQINCAVTLSLVLVGKLPWYQGVANTVAQLLGSVLGAAFLAGLFTCEDDLTASLGSNIINERFGLQALPGEVFGTFLLCTVVFHTAVSPAASAGVNAPIAIGFAVFLAHLVLLPIDGCSINPTRSFGPAVIAPLRSCSDDTKLAPLEDLWVMILGPVLGAIIASALYKYVLAEPSELQRAPPGQAKDGETTKKGDGPGAVVLAEDVSV